MVALDDLGVPEQLNQRGARSPIIRRMSHRGWVCSISTLLQLTFEYLALGHTAAGHGDPSAGFGERQGRGPTNPGQGAGNENDRAVHDQTPSRHDVGRMAVRPLAYGNHGTQAP